MPSLLNQDTLQEVMGHLTLPSLKALSLCSKEWRAYCEPFLYRKLDLSRDNGQYVRVVDMRSAGYLQHVKELIIPDEQAVNALEMFLNRLRGGLLAYFPHLHSLHVRGAYGGTGPSASSTLDDLFPDGIETAMQLDIRLSYSGPINEHSFKAYRDTITHIKLQRCDFAQIDWLELSKFPNLIRLDCVDLTLSRTAAASNPIIKESSGRISFGKLESLDCRWRNRTASVRPTIARLSALDTPNLGNWTFLLLSSNNNHAATDLLALPPTPVQPYKLHITSFGLSTLVRTYLGDFDRCTTLAWIKHITIQVVPENKDLSPLLDVLKAKPGVLRSLASIHIENCPPDSLSGPITQSDIEAISGIFWDELQRTSAEVGVSLTLAGIVDPCECDLENPLASFRYASNSLHSLRFLLQGRTPIGRPNPLPSLHTEQPVTFSTLEILKIKYVNDGRGTNNPETKELELAFLIDFLVRNHFPNLRYLELDIQMMDMCIIETLADMIAAGDFPSLYNVHGFIVGKSGNSWRCHGGKMAKLASRLQTVLEEQGVGQERLLWSAR